MATWYSNELAGIDSQPAVKPNAISGYNATLKRFRATVPMSNPAIQSGDVVQLFRLPVGSCFAFAIMTASATMGASATLAIGTAASAGKYRAAATFTTADTPTMVGLTTNVAMTPYTAEEAVILTIAAAALPTSGTLVIDFYVNIP